MTEAGSVVMHMSRLMRHCERRLQTTAVWDWNLLSLILNGENLDVDVREALVKILKLRHRYYQLFERRGGRIRTCSVVDHVERVAMSNCDICECAWVVDLWKYGDWTLVRKDEYTDQYWILISVHGNELAWMSELDGSMVKTQLNYNI